MALTDPLNQSDVINLKTIKKKLGLSMRQLSRAQAINRDPNLSADEKARLFLQIPDGVDTNEFLEKRLSEREIVTIKKFVNL